MSSYEHDKLSAWSISALKSVGAIALALTIALTFAQVVLRYFFNNPQAWSEEISRYLFIWITVIGIASAYFNDTNIKIDLMPGLAGSGWKKLVKLMRCACELLAVAAIGYSGLVVMVNKSGAKFFTIPHLPQMIFHIAIPVCFGLSSLYITVRMKCIIEK